MIHIVLVKNNGKWVASGRLYKEDEARTIYKQTMNSNPESAVMLVRLVRSSEGTARDV